MPIRVAQVHPHPFGGDAALQLPEGFANDRPAVVLEGDDERRM
jgi:hypothetical protein